MSSKIKAYPRTSLSAFHAPSLLRAVQSKIDDGLCAYCFLYIYDTYIRKEIDAREISLFCVSTDDGGYGGLRYGASRTNTQDQFYWSR
jgi:hypothetical protein